MEKKVINGLNYYEILVDGIETFIFRFFAVMRFFTAANGLLR